MASFSVNQKITNQRIMILQHSNGHKKQPACWARPSSYRLRDHFFFLTPEAPEDSSEEALSSLAPAGLSADSGDEDLFSTAPPSDAGASLPSMTKVFLSTASVPDGAGASGESMTKVFLSTYSEPEGEGVADAGAGAAVGVGVATGAGATVGTELAMLLTDELTVEITVVTVEPAVTSEAVPESAAVQLAGLPTKQTAPSAGTII
jgi:hypothetical protein